MYIIQKMDYEIDWISTGDHDVCMNNARTHEGSPSWKLPTGIVVQLGVVFNDQSKLTDETSRWSY